MKEREEEKGKEEEVWLGYPTSFLQFICKIAWLGNIDGNMNLISICSCWLGDVKFGLAEQDLAYLDLLLLTAKHRLILCRRVRKKSSS